MTSMDFADGIVLLSPDSKKMQDKTDIIAKNPSAIGLKISIKKNKTMKINCDTDNIKLEGEELGNVINFQLPWQQLFKQRQY